MGVLDSIPGIVAQALGPIFKPATLTVASAKTPDGRGGFTRSTTAHACQAILTDYSDALRALSNGSIALRDRKAIIIAKSLPAGVAPAIGDTLTIEGEDWAAVTVKRDPASATFEIQARPSR